MRHRQLQFDRSPPPDGAVPPGWQGGGNGGALMDQALAVARKRKAERLLLAVYEVNARAIAFYKRQGFAHIGEAVFMVADVPFRDMVFARKMDM